MGFCIFGQLDYEQEHHEVLHAKVILCFFAMIKRVFFSCERSNSIFRSAFEHENIRARDEEDSYKVRNKL